MVACSWLAGPLRPGRFASGAAAYTISGPSLSGYPRVRRANANIDQGLRQGGIAKVDRLQVHHIEYESLRV